jgi:hypothetical protein
MAALLSSPVSTGFVARAHERFAERLEAAGFDDAMRSALVGEPVLCGDETPVNVAHTDSDEHGTPVPGAPHVLTVRTPEERLVWYRALPARTKVALRNLGVLGAYAGYLVRDDYAGWHQFDKQVAGVQQCVAHLFRHLQGVLDLHPDHQAWAGTVRACCARPTRPSRPPRLHLRRPWEKAATKPGRLTPARIRTALPAGAPKPSRPGPGRPPGSRNAQRAPRHDPGKTIKTDTAVKGGKKQAA